jgi:ribosomal protein L11 methylase PrmA
VAIDNDCTAIAVAKSSARLNNIRGASFQLGDVGKWKSGSKTDVITANLYTGLLMQIMPKLKGSRWLILSGMLRHQEHVFRRALRRNQIEEITIKRRGKWIAILARCSGALPSRSPVQGARFCGGHRPPLQ